jgi:hypothetical protein
MIIVGEVFFRSGTIVCRDSTARFPSRKGNGFAAEDADIARLASGKPSTTFCSMTRIDSSSTYSATARWNTLAGIMVCAMVGVEEDKMMLKDKRTTDEDEEASR